VKEKRKRYEFKLLTMAPVHIGSGEHYTQKEYVYEDGHYYFPDMVKLYQVIEQRGAKTVEAFESFLMQGGNRNHYKTPRLAQFLKEHHIERRDFGGYKVAETGLELVAEKNTPKGNLNEITRFMKDPYGQAYIPGSSLKGAIRTILANEHFKTDDVPWGSKKYEPFNDVFHNIRVTDSEAIAASNLMLAQKWDYSIPKNEPKPLPIYRESIKPFVRVSFEITAVGDEAIDLIDRLGKLSQKHYKQYKEYFLSTCPKNLVQANVQYPIYLGAGSGFWTKTIIDKGDPKRHRRGLTEMKGKGTFKLTKAKNKTFKTPSGKKHLIANQEDFYEMGKCNFIYKEIE
jgi:CRISPR-associated protein Csm5